ncbi:AI-2E family transporter [bacterium]|nr:AI-2E family transporter [bacterium]
MKMFENLFPKYMTAKNVVFFTLLILAVVFILRNTDIMILFFASFVLACSLNPFVDKLSAKFSRGTAAAIVIVGMLIFLGLFLIPTIILSANEIKTFAVSFPEYIDKLDDFLDAQPMLDKIGLNHVDIDTLMGYVANSSSDIISHVANIGTYVGTALVYIIIGIMIMYYFMADKDLLRDTFISMFPVQMRKRSGDIHDIITKKIGGYMAAQIVTMASVGVVMTIGLLIAGIEYAFLLGLLTGILDIIPVVGPGIALVIGLITTYQLGIGAIIAVIISFAVAQVVENQLVRPYIFGKFLDLHPLMIYLFLFIMAKYAGVVGVIFAPAVAAIVAVLIQELYIKHLQKNV